MNSNTYFEERTACITSIEEAAHEGKRIGYDQDGERLELLLKPLAKAMGTNLSSR